MNSSFWFLLQIIVFSLETLNKEFPFPDLFQSSLQKSPAAPEIWEQQLLRHPIASEQREKSYWTRKKLLKESHSSHYKNINSYMEVTTWDQCQMMQFLRNNHVQQNTVVRYSNWCTTVTSIVTNGLIDWSVVWKG